jgi:hypothetical protein
MRDKRAKFVELANKRVNGAIRDLRLIANLSNRSNYEFNEDDVRKIFRTLQKELDAAKGQFGDNSGSSNKDFQL